MSEKVCPRCGTTLEEFRRTSLLGCANCYTAFRDEVLGAVRLVQGKTRHVGKVPADGAEENHAIVLEMELLKEEIERALKEERFEDAEAMSERLREYNRLLGRVEGKR